MAAGKPLSLKARAIALLAQREHSSAELRRKLLRIARDRDRAAALAKAGDGAARQDAFAEPDEESAANAAEVEQLLVWLQDQGYLSEERFVESRLHLRAQRFGGLRIKQELAQHGLALSPEQVQALREGELDRAREVRRRKFGEAPPLDQPDRAKQSRFLAARGFSPETIRRALKSES